MVQARVVAGGAGTITGYKEPSGPGIRVDACGYLGHTPPPHFDPLLAKLICSVSAAGSFDAVLQRTLHALDEFHIAGIPTNLGQLAAILGREEVRDGNARTNLVSEHPELVSAGAPRPTGMLSLLQQRSATAVDSARAGVQRDALQHVELAVAEGATAVESPITGSVVQVAVAAGAQVSAGETLLVINTMKMETEISAPCSGVITAIQTLAEGDGVVAGQTLATITPSAGDAERDAKNSDINETWRSESVV